MTVLDKSILMIAYFFPPIGGSGSLRPSKLANYLPEFGWRPVVLSVKNPDWYYAADKALLDEMPCEVERHYSLMFRSAWVYYLLNPFRIKRLEKMIRDYLLHPDEQVGWIPFGYKAASKIVRQRKINALYSTSSPLSSHLIAWLIHKKFGIPWVADFRDEWVENPDIICPTAVHRRLHYCLEKAIVENADRVITAAPEFCRLLKKHPACAECTTFFMGFDPRDQRTHQNKSIPEKRSDVFTLVFSGIFYGSFRPDRLLKVINGLIDREMVPIDGIRVVFVGANSAADLNELDKYHVFEFTGFIAHQAALDYVFSADALLLLLSEERGKNTIPSKTFEYMSSGKPILALIPPDGDVAEVIRRTKTGLVADFRDETAIEKAFLSLYRQWQGDGKPFRPDMEAIAAFDQRLITGSFASLLDAMTRDG